MTLRPKLLRRLNRRIINPGLVNLVKILISTVIASATFRMLSNSGTMFASAHFLSCNQRDIAPKGYSSSPTTYMGLIRTREQAPDLADLRPVNNNSRARISNETPRADSTQLYHNYYYHLWGTPNIACFISLLSD